MESADEILKKSYAIKSPTNTKELSKVEISPDSASANGLGKQDCPFCGGLGYIIPDVAPIEKSFGRAIVCSCRENEVEQKKKNNLLKLSQLSALREATFETFATKLSFLTEIQNGSLEAAFNKTKDFAHNPSGWIVLVGTYGCGKTHLAAAVANYQIELGNPVLFVNTPDLLDYLRSSFSTKSEADYDKRIDTLRSSPLLILDDLGVENATDWSQEKLYQILNYRYYNRIPTIITTNKKLTTFEERLSSRLLDHQLVEIVSINAQDFRRSHGSGVNPEYSELSSLHLHLDKRLKTFDLRERELPREEADNLKRALGLVEDFVAKPTGWLVLSSVGYGNGKTHLAAAAANELMERGESVLFISVPDLLDHLRASFNPHSEVRYDKRFQEIKSADFLVLDDLGTESATAWAKEKLYQLFNYRYNARLPTIITTALHIDHIDPRLATRMLDETLCTYFAITAPSYRGGIKLKRSRKR